MFTDVSTVQYINLKKTQTNCQKVMISTILQTWHIIFGSHMEDDTSQYFLTVCLSLNRSIYCTEETFVKDDF